MTSGDESTRRSSACCCSEMDRVVVLVDMDCFYVQVEQRKDPSLRGRPCAVVQYKNWRGGRYVVTAINGVVATSDMHD